MEDKTTQSQGVRPPSALYTAAVAAVRFLARIFFGFRVIEETPLPQKGPLVVLCSHQGMLDFAFVAAAVRRKMHFVASRRFFEQRPWGRLLESLGVVPKIQFHPDPRSIASMLRIVKQGGCICLFPAGQTSMCGVPGAIAPSIVRLVRKAGGTVAAVQLQGSFFAMPRFAPGTFTRGKVEARLRVLYTPEALAGASDGQVLEEICRAIGYNEYAWQEATGHLFRGRNRAKGMANVLYACPRCGAEYQMRSQGNRLTCGACGNTALVGRDMHFHKGEEKSVLFPTLLDWYRWQEQGVYARIDDYSRPFLLETPAQAAIYENQKPLRCGRGTLTMDREGVGFEGQIKGQPASLRIRHANLPGLTVKTGAYLELYHQEWGLVRYYPENPQAVTLWKIAQEYLHTAAGDWKQKES